MTISVTLICATNENQFAKLTRTFSGKIQLTIVIPGLIAFLNRTISMKTGIVIKEPLTKKKFREKKRISVKSFLLEEH